MLHQLELHFGSKYRSVRSDAFPERNIVHDYFVLLCYSIHVLETALICIGGSSRRESFFDTVIFITSEAEGRASFR